MHLFRTCKRGVYVLFKGGCAPPPSDPPWKFFFRLKHSVKYPLSENKHQKKKKVFLKNGGQCPPYWGEEGPPPGKFVLAYVTCSSYRLVRVQIWTKSDKNYGRESAAYENSKWPPMTSSNWDIENLRKMSQAHVLETICVKFHQNRPSH